MQAFLTLSAGAGHRVVVGHDRRESSPAAARFCLATLQGNGRSVDYAGVVPTPAVAFASAEWDCAGVMITGSHTEAEWNGMKFFVSGRELTNAEERALATAARPQSAATVTDLPAPDRRVLAGFVRRYTGAFPNGALRGLTLGLCDYGSAADGVLDEVLSGLGAQIVRLGTPAGFTAIDTEALPPRLVSDARRWAEEKCPDAILSADADGDRPLIADENGAWIRGDIIGLIAARACSARSVVTPVTATRAAEASGYFDRVIRTRIGSPHVIAAMDGGGLAAPVAGYEANGGFLLGSDIELARGPVSALRTRDAVLPILLVLSALQEEGLPLSRMLSKLPPHHTASARIAGVAAEQSRELIAELSARLPDAAALLGPAEGAILSVDCSEGLRCRFASGAIVHLRASGNAPDLRCYAEARTPGAAEASCSDALARVQQRLSTSRPS